MITGERIRKRREALNITQEALAKACGITKQNIFKYEHGIVVNIPRKNIEIIAEALSVTPAYLMGWES